MPLLLRLELQDLVALHLGCDVEKVTPDADFAKDLGADSLDVIELVLSVETEFDIDIADNYADKIKSVQDALDYLKENHDINV
jgi:acyl carrier protein